MMNKTHKTNQNNNAMNQLIVTSGCNPNEIEVKRQPALANNFDIIIAIISVILIIMILYPIYIYFKGHKENNLYSRFSEFSQKTLSSFTFAFLISLLTWSFLLSFINNILNPIIQSTIPDYEIMNKPVLLRTYYQENPDGSPKKIDITMTPGEFFINFISYILCIIFIFIIIEIFNLLSQISIINSLLSFNTGYFILVILVILFLVWNVIQKNNIPIITMCVPNTPHPNTEDDKTEDQKTH